MATIQLRLSTKISNGRAEILCRFYEGSVGFRAKMRIFAICDAWDDQYERMVVPKKHTSLSGEIQDTNARIDALCEHIHKQWALDRYANNPSSWLQNIIDTAQQINAPRKHTIILLDAVHTYADERKASYGTYRNIMTLHNHLDKYAHPIALAAVTPEYIHSFADYLYTLVAPNTAKKMLSTLRSVCNKAVNDEQLMRSPFGGSRGYVIGQSIYGSPQYLTVQERDYLASFEGLPAKLAIQRDIFIFQCHTGCRVSDLRSLTIANIQPGGWLEYIAKKTIDVSGATVRVPLSAIALEIIARYRHTRLVRGKDNKMQEFAEYINDPDYDAVELLPFISDQKYNQAIHDIFVLAGLSRPIVTLDKHTGQPTTTTLDTIATSHLARKTFSQNIYSRAGGDARVAAAFTGHSPNSRAFARYNEVDDTMKRAIIGL